MRQNTSQRGPMLCRDGKVRLKWEDTEIEVPLNFENMNEVVLYKVVRNMENKLITLQTELEELRNEQSQYIRYKFQRLSNIKAEEEIVRYLKSKKKETTRLTIFEISQEIKLPANQVERIIEKLEKEGKVSLI